MISVRDLFPETLHGTGELRNVLYEDQNRAMQNPSQKTVGRLDMSNVPLGSAPLKTLMKFLNIANVRYRLIMSTGSDFYIPLSKIT